jgi:hypothetical protein
VNELPLTTVLVLSRQFSRYRKYEIPKLELGRPEFETAYLLFKRSSVVEPELLAEAGAGMSKFRLWVS